MLVYSIARLARLAAHHETKQYLGGRRLFISLFWFVFRMFPDSGKRRLMSWKIDAKSPPAWLRRLAKLMRRGA